MGNARSVHRNNECLLRTVLLDAQAIACGAALTGAGGGGLQGLTWSVSLSLLLRAVCGECH